MVQQGDEMKRCPGAEPNNNSLRKAVKMDGFGFRKVPKAAS